MSPNEKQQEGKCWLCGEHGPLTLEHIPPHVAFNQHPLLLRQISERSVETGVLSWDQGRQYRKGFAVRSLCGRCNNRAGQRFAPPYIEFIKTVAERIGSTRLRHRLTIQKIRKPQLILKQVIQQFVTANGSTFVEANPWMRRFLQPETSAKLPPEICVYLFATNMSVARTTGISGHVQAGPNHVRIVSEFTYWPVGTVLSYGELPNEELAPIHHWARLPYKGNETRDLTLTVNAAASALPIDFRTTSEILKDRGQPVSILPSESSLESMRAEVLRRSGSPDQQGFVYTASPEQVELFRAARKS